MCLTESTFRILKLDRETDFFLTKEWEPCNMRNKSCAIYVVYVNLNLHVACVNCSVNCFSVLSTIISVIIH